MREARFQGFDAGLELAQCIVQSAQIGLHSSWGLLPVLWSEGKRPVGVREIRQRFHDVPSQQPSGSDTGYVIAARGDQVQRKMSEE